MNKGKKQNQDDLKDQLLLYKIEELDGFPLNFQLGSQGNTGLWYEKFCHTWNRMNGEWTLDKKKWIDAFSGQVGNRIEIQQMIERMCYMVEHLEGSFLWMRTAERFVTGLGRSHPVENGFSFHPTLGTPYLPGSSIKGLVKQWAIQWDEEINDEVILRIFGSISDKESSQKSQETRKPKVGNILFFDALPLKPIQLEVDIMTSHHMPYYENPNKENARNIHDPIPIPFLVVASGQPFLFSIAPREKNEQSREDLKKVMKWLKDALEWLGAGAKTAVGYGRFDVDTKRQREWEEEKEARKREEELAQMNPIQREMAEDGYNDDPERFMEALTKKWLDRMETEIENQVEIAQQLKAWYLTNRQDQWYKPKGKNKEKVQRIKNILELVNQGR